MEQVIEQDNKHKYLLLLFTFLIFVLVILITAFIYLKNRQTISQSNNSPQIQITPTPTLTEIEKQDLTQGAVAIASVGKESIYQSDLNYQLNTFYFKDKDKPVTKEKALTDLINDSIILQEGIKNNYIFLTAGVFNNPNKTTNEITQRNILITAVKKKIEDMNIDSVNGEAIVMYFNNTPNPTPTIGVAKAKEIVRAKMEKYYQDLLANKYTMAQAGNLIKEDTSQRQIDLTYTANAYIKFDNLRRDEQIFVDNNLNQQIWTLGTNAMSAILTGKSNGYEEFYTIIKVNVRNGKFPSITDWVNSIKNNYEIKIY